MKLIIEFNDQEELLESLILKEGCSYLRDNTIIEFFTKEFYVGSIYQDRERLEMDLVSTCIRN